MGLAYRKISPHIWNDEKFRQLSAEQQRLAIYALTAQANRIGLFLFSPGRAAEDLHLAPKAVNAWLLAVWKRLGWSWDARVRLLFIPSWWKYNAPEAWNNMIGNLKDLAALPRSPLLDQFANHSRYLPETMKSQFVQVLAHALGKGSPHPSPTLDQDLDQDLELEQELDTDKGNATSNSLCSLSAEEVRTAWNKITGVTPCNAITGVLLTRIAGLAKQHDQKWWVSFFAEIQASKFLTAQISSLKGKTPLKVTLDWVTQPDHVAKILAGNYADVPKVIKVWL